MKKKKEEAQKLIRKASQKIKRLSIQSKSRYSELENNLKKVTTKLEKENSVQMEELRNELKNLEQEMKKWEIEIDPVLRNQRFNSFKFIEASILRKRLATFINRIPKSSINSLNLFSTANYGNGIVECEECYGDKGHAELFSFKSKKTIKKR